MPHCLGKHVLLLSRNHMQALRMQQFIKDKKMTQDLEATRRRSGQLAWWPLLFVVHVTPAPKLPKRDGNRIWSSCSSSMARIAKACINR